MTKRVSILISALALLVCLSFSFSADAAQPTATDDKLIDISENTSISVSLSEKSFIYDGTEKTPEIKVKKGKKTLVNGADYEVSYSDNINVGTATAEINGIGKYTGTITKSFSIKKLSFTKNDDVRIVLDKTTFIYNGKAATPKVEVYLGDNSSKLKKGRDYEVTYTDNKAIGRATVKISGIGNYKGSASEHFYIKPKKIKNLKIKDVTSSSVNLKWSRITGVSGYKIYSYQPGKKTYKLVGTVNSAKTGNFVIKNLEPKIQYSFCVCAFKNVGDKKYYGEYSDKITAAVKPQKVTLKACGKDKNKLKVEWYSVKCSGYEVFYSTDKNMKNGVKTVKVGSDKTSCTISGIDKSKAYYVKVRAYIKMGSTILNGAKSDKLSSNYENVYASYSSYYENNPNRTNNLRIASNAINGTIIFPGETFDFNQIVGPRTAAKGYKAAHVFTNGTTISNEIGGGICQVASTIFNCALKANVEIVERHQHAQRVAYVPLGRDAAIYGTANNFRWKNNTDYPILVKMSVKDGIISCSFNTWQKVKPKKVELKVYQNGNTFTLNRVVDGKVNYSCKSNY